MGNSSTKSEDLVEGELQLELEHVSFFEGSHFKSVNWKKLTQLKSELVTGDMIAVTRGVQVTHFMVYLNDDWVIHFYAKGNSNKKATTQTILEYMFANFGDMVGQRLGDQEGAIALEKIEHVIGPNDKCGISNQTNQVWYHCDSLGLRKVCRTPEKIVEAARKAFNDAGSGLPVPKYNLRYYNCETFAIELRYGIQACFQTGDYAWLPKDDL